MNQRWNQAAIDKLARMAADGADKVEMAETFDCTPNAIRLQAAKYGIVLPALKNPKRRGGAHRGQPRSINDDELRARWEKLLPGMKAKLRASIGGTP